MNLRTIFIVFLKELRETLRDRRSIIAMFVVPTVVIPAVTFGFALTSVKLVKKARQEIPTVMVLGGEDSPRIRAVLEKQKTFRVLPPGDDFAEQISQKKLRAALEIPPHFDAALDRGERVAVTIYSHDGEMRSSFAVEAVERVLRSHRDNIVRQRLAEHGLAPEALRPFDTKRENVAPPEKVGGNVFGGFIPYLFIILCFTGAMYPAIDLTAGEKERGTLETLLCSPAARSELVIGKFLVVLCASLATVSAALVSMGGSALIAGASWMHLTASAHGGTFPTVSVPGMIGVLVLVLPLAMFFSALLMTIALLAKSHKEAQTYVSPLMILAVLPAAAAVLPGVELTNTLALVPILNIALVSKELVAGSFPVVPLLLIFVSTCVYAAGALALAVRMFHRENVLFRT
jgi:ABC-type Na+ efflux pump, permease component